MPLRDHAVAGYRAAVPLPCSAGRSEATPLLCVVVRRHRQAPLREALALPRERVLEGSSTGIPPLPDAAQRPVVQPLAQQCLVDAAAQNLDLA